MTTLGAHVISSRLRIHGIFRRLERIWLVGASLTAPNRFNLPKFLTVPFASILDLFIYAPSVHYLMVNEGTLF